MVRTLGRRTRPARGGAGAGKRRARPTAPWRGRWLWVLPLAGLAGLAPVVWRRPTPQTPPGQAEALSALDAEVVGSRLAAQGHYVASLPYYRRIVDQYGSEWMAHANYSSALHNAAQESRSHLGGQAPAMRSSIERMAVMAVSLGEQDLAELHADVGHDRALALFQGGQSLQTWGFPIEALVTYRRGLEHAPNDAGLIRVEKALDLLLAQGGVEGRGH